MTPRPEVRRAGPRLPVAISDPDAEVARRILQAYFDDLVSRYYRRPATAAEVERAMAEAPSDDLAEPHGVLWVANGPGGPVGCVGLRLVAGGVGEVTRMFVAPDARRRGLGSVLLGHLEQDARARGLATLRLDTRDDLVEARRLYARHGFEEVAPFSDGPYAEHWFAKAIT